MKSVKRSDVKRVVRRLVVDECDCPCCNTKTVIKEIDVLTGKTSCDECAEDFKIEG